jgi:hypothetical protein
LTPLSQSSGTVELEIGAWVEMAFLRPLTASLTLHPAHVVPMAGHECQTGVRWAVCKLKRGKRTYSITAGRMMSGMDFK